MADTAPVLLARLLSPLAAGDPAHTAALAAALHTPEREAFAARVTAVIPSSPDARRKVQQSLGAVMARIARLPLAADPERNAEALTMVSLAGLVSVASPYAADADPGLADDFSAWWTGTVLGL
jgi:hypothetical protein